jgi:hypothetical protein
MNNFARTHKSLRINAESAAGLSGLAWSFEEIRDTGVIEAAMGTQNGPYQADFPVGAAVRIKSRSFLEEFQRTWKLHHPLQDAQLEYAGRTATVLSVGFYHGGDELYDLEKVPGTWNEPCLENQI